MTRGTLKPRVLLVHRCLHPNGGGNAVAAWTIEALKDRARLTLLTLFDFDFGKVNRTFGTALIPGEIEVVLAPAWMQAIVEAVPTQGEQLRLGLLMTEARKLLRRREYDVAIGTDNETDFGLAGLQYVHYPWHRPPLPGELRPIHRVPGLLRAYRWAAGPLLGVSMERIRRNRTLTNSAFVAGKIRDVHCIDATVVYPPVPGGFPPTSWKERETAFVGIGRLHPMKRWGAAVEVVAALRARGFPASLHVIGFPEHPEETRRMCALAAKHEWLKLHMDAPRVEMVRIVAAQRYGLHMMHEEHFGIGVAELLRAGCIPFAHHSGGPPEILGCHPELLFQTDEEAVEKIAAVLSSGDLQADLLARLEPRRQEFSEQRFMAEIRREVGVLAGVDLG